MTPEGRTLESTTRRRAPSNLFAGLLRQSMAALEAELPAAYQRLGQVLGERPVRLAIDGETLRIAFRPGFVELGELGEREQEIYSTECHEVEVESSRDAILGLLEGRTSLLRAIERERLAIRGAAQDLVAFLDGLRVYLDASLRCPSFPRLLAEYRNSGPHVTVEKSSLRENKL